MVRRAFLLFWRVCSLSVRFRLSRQRVLVDAFDVLAHLATRFLRLFHVRCPGSGPGAGPVPKDLLRTRDL